MSLRHEVTLQVHENQDPLQYWRNESSTYIFIYIKKRALSIH